MSELGSNATEIKIARRGKIKKKMKRYREVKQSLRKRVHRNNRKLKITQKNSVILDSV